MPAGDSLVSSDRHFTLTMQSDGNLVEHVTGASQVVWSSGTGGHPNADVIMQDDGNLVIYGGASGALWSSGTAGQGPGDLTVQPDAELVVRKGTTTYWSSGSYDDVLEQGETLLPGQYLESGDGHYTVIMQTDGNLVEYVSGTNHVLWSSGTGGHPNADVIMQDDGNLVIYGGASGALWSSGTAGDKSTAFFAQSDANLVVYSGTTPVWQSATYNHLLLTGEVLKDGWYLESGNGYELIMQNDGNLVEYGPTGALWSSGTVGHGGDFLIMQDDGNLVIYGASGPLWSSGTVGAANAQLNDQQDGNEVIYSNGAPVWATNTSVTAPLTTGTWPGTAGPGAAAKYYGYPYSNPPACTDHGACIADKWLFFQGQCTSWVAYRLNQLNGIAFSNSFGGDGRWSDASNWGPHARALGITVNGTPAVGSVAWYSAGHVAYVEKVNSPTSVVISEMNYDNDNGFRVRTITTASGWPTGFIHIHDR
ncbi:MAG TPA: CHAP domain-containing protein [Streptosporangiaceae bacterium]|nr:CHAP domain-containing protein [Streptosporangiaceae bacterium]